MHFPLKDGKVAFMTKKMDGRVFIYHMSRNFYFDNPYLILPVAIFYTDLACKQTCFPRKSVKRKKKSVEEHNRGTDDKNQSLRLFYLSNFITER